MTREEHIAKIDEIIKENKCMKTLLGEQNILLFAMRDYTPADVDEAYQCGLDDAWECARRLLFSVEDGGMSTSELCEIFHRYGSYSILKDYSVQEVMKRIEEYEKQKDVIKNGEWEEVEVIADAYDISGVKTWASKMKCDQCGFTTIAIEGHFSQYNFCPSCGTDMRGEQDE